MFDAPPLASDMDPAQQYPFIHKHMGHLFDKKRLLIGYATVPPRPSRSRNTSTSSVASEAGAAASWVEQEMSYEHAQERSSGVISSTVAYGQERRRKNSDGDGELGTNLHDFLISLMIRWIDTDLRVLDLRYRSRSIDPSYQPNKEVCCKPE